MSLRALADELGISKTFALRFRKGIRAQLRGERAEKKKPTVRLYSQEECVAAVEAVLFGGLSKHEADEQFNLPSVKTLEPWIRRSQAGRPDALAGRHRCPHLNLPADQRALVEEVVALHAENALVLQGGEQVILLVGNDACIAAIDDETLNTKTTSPRGGRSLASRYPATP